MNLRYTLLLFLATAAWGQQQNDCPDGYVRASEYTCVSTAPLVKHIHVCGYESPGDTECVELPPVYTPTIADLCPPEVGCHFETLPGSDEERVADAAIFAFAHIGPKDISTTQPTVTAMVEETSYIHGCYIHVGEGEWLTVTREVEMKCHDGWLTIRDIVK